VLRCDTGGRVGDDACADTIAGEGGGGECAREGGREGADEGGRKGTGVGVHGAAGRGGGMMIGGRSSRNS
jgi:hypothetical protein